MIIDASYIESLYERIKKTAAETSQALGRPLLLAEKILYTHLTGHTGSLKDIIRGKSSMNTTGVPGSPSFSQG